MLLRNKARGREGFRTRQVVRSNDPLRLNDQPLRALFRNAILLRPGATVLSLALPINYCVLPLSPKITCLSGYQYVTPWGGRCCMLQAGLSVSANKHRVEEPTCFPSTSQEPEHSVLLFCKPAASLPLTLTPDGERAGQRG